MNNYVPVRSYRGARQCLLMHSRMLSVVAAATAALSNGTFIFPQSASAVDLFTSDDGGLSGPCKSSIFTTSSSFCMDIKSIVDVGFH